MRFLANENFPLLSVIFLRGIGYDITHIGQDYSGITDTEVIQIAIKEERTILTFDKDYSDLVFKHNYRPEKGIIFFRLVEFDPKEPGQILELVLKSNDFDPERALTVIGRNAIRQKKY